MRNSGGLLQARAIHGVARGNTAKLISAYYLEIEYLLDLVERSASHYQALGVERTATGEEIILAYHRAVTVFHPSYHKVRAAVPDELLVRIDQAFNKVSHAFSVLTNPRRRIEYDRSLLRRVVTPIQFKGPKAYHTNDLDPESDPGDVAGVTGQAQAAPGEVVDINITNAERPLYTKLTSEAATVNRRRCERFKISVPSLVAGYMAENGKWQEVTKTIDVSRMGVALQLRRRVRHGAVLHVTLPLPTKLRSHGFTEPGYNMYAIVRRTEPPADGLRVVGLEFLGAHPPAGYLHKPWATFRTPRWTGVERRRDPRQERAEPIVISYINEEGQPIAQEVTVTENISAGGARVTVKTPPPEFEMVKVTSADRSFESHASVRNRYTGSDGVDRLCLQFLERRWSLKT